MVRGVDLPLYVVGDHAGAAPARCHRAAIGIGQRYLLVGRGKQCLFNRGQPFHFFFELRQLFLKPRLGQQHRFRRLFSCGSLAVGGVELAHVARHTLFDLLLATLDLALREVVIATAQAKKYRHVRHSISYQTSTSGPYPTAGVSVPRNGGYGTSGTSVGTVTAPSIGTYSWPSVGGTNAVPPWSNPTPAVR